MCIPPWMHVQARHWVCLEGIGQRFAHLQVPQSNIAAKTELVNTKTHTMDEDGHRRNSTTASEPLTGIRLVKGKASKFTWMSALLRFSIAAPTADRRSAGSWHWRAALSAGVIGAKPSPWPGAGASLSWRLACTHRPKVSSSFREMPCSVWSDQIPGGAT